MKCPIPAIYICLILSTFSVFSAVDQPKPEVELTAVYINNATAKELSKKLSGIGIKKATNIVNYRNKHGRFKSIDELNKVDGISRLIISKNKAKMKIN